MKQLDDTDLRILTQLQLQGRLANQALAASVGLSPSACSARLRELEKHGVIRRYLADIRLEAVGPAVTLYAEVALAQHRLEDFAVFERVIAQIPEIVEAAQVSGPADYILKVVTRDVDAWRRIADLLSEKAGAIASLKTNIVLKTAKRFGGIPIGALAGPAPAVTRD